MSKKVVFLGVGLLMASMAQGSKSTWDGLWRDFDITISYWGFPSGDDNGNTQAGNPENWDKSWSDQDKIETIIQYAANCSGAPVVRQALHSNAATTKRA